MLRGLKISNQEKLLEILFQAEIGKNERELSSFQFTHVHEWTFTHICWDFKFMNVSELSSYFWWTWTEIQVHLSSDSWGVKKHNFDPNNQLLFYFFFKSSQKKASINCSHFIYAYFWFTNPTTVNFIVNVSELAHIFELSKFMNVRELSSHFSGNEREWT